MPDFLETNWGHALYMTKQQRESWSISMKEKFLEEYGEKVHSSILFYLLDEVLKLQMAKQCPLVFDKTKREYIWRSHSPTVCV